MNFKVGDIVRLKEQYKRYYFELLRGTGTVTKVTKCKTTPGQLIEVDYFHEYHNSILEKVHDNSNRRSRVCRLKHLPGFIKDRLYKHLRG